MKTCLHQLLLFNSLYNKNTLLTRGMCKRRIKNNCKFYQYLDLNYKLIVILPLM